MQTLEILFIATMVVAIIVAIKFFFSVKQDQEYTITLNIESEDILHPKMSSGAKVQTPTSLANDGSEPVAKPKRRYKKRKKKVVAPAVETPVAQVTPAVKKAVGRPKKTV